MTLKRLPGLGARSSTLPNCPMPQNFAKRLARCHGCSLLRGETCSINQRTTTQNAQRGSCPLGLFGAAAFPPVIPGLSRVTTHSHRDGPRLHVGAETRALGRLPITSVDLTRPQAQPVPNGSRVPSVALHRPFTGTPVRHCIGHLWPNATNEMWRWNLNQLLRRIDLFNGRRILSVALDSRTISRERIERILNGYGFEITYVENQPQLGEVVSFPRLLEALQPEFSDPNACVFYWHGKGCGGRREQDPAIVREWAETMWAVNLDHWPLVESHLAEAAATGAFRQGWWDTKQWIFAGSFFWIRANAIPGREWRRIDADRFGVETWPGKHFTASESRCLFLDRLSQGRTLDCLYRANSWDKIRCELKAFQRQPIPPSPHSPHHTPSVAIIITCGPRYDRWVRDAVQSACEQEGAPEIVVVFDRCEPILLPHGVKALNVDFGAVQKARQAGIAATRGEVLFFLDADNAYQGTQFVRNATEQLVAASRANPRVAGVSVDIDYYDHQWNKHTHPRLSTPDWDRGRFERENFLDTCTPVWRYALESSWVQTVANGSHEDHHLLRQLVRDGWTVAKGRDLTLKYRFCPDSSSTRKNQGNYAQRYDLHHQPLTIFIPLSGRLWAWPDMRNWLAQLARTERGRSVRLVLCDTSGSEGFGEQVRSEGTSLSFADVRYYRQSVASPGLADLDRAKHERAVQLACARIYNRFAQECTTHLALILEDDILPHLSGEETLRQLIDGFGPTVAAVSGVYLDRRNGGVNSWTASTVGRNRHMTQAEMDAANADYLPIAGTGFGFLMIRREVLQAVPQALPPGELWYDPRFFREVTRSGLSVMLAKRVTCDHRDAPQLPATGGKRRFDLDWFSQHIPTWVQHLSHLRGTPCQLLEVGSFEGRSAIWLAENLMSHPGSRLTCIDAGIGVGHTAQLHRLQANLASLKNRDQVQLRIGSSIQILPTLSGPLDAIYIDGSHLGGDAIRDLCNAWPMLAAGGVLLIDDYRYEEQGIPPHAWAGPAIDYFLSLYQDQIEIVHKGNQVLLRKQAP